MNVAEKTAVRKLVAACLAPGTSPVRSRALLRIWLLGVLAAAWIQVGVYGSPIFPVDDAYITLHNARVLISGRDPNFPGISPLSGATSPVHLLLVAALASVLGAPWALWLATWLGAALLAAGALRLAVVLEAPIVVTAVVPFLALASGDNAVQLMNGLETGLAMAAATWAFVLHLHPSARLRRWLPALVGAMPFLRPELALLGLGLLADRALQEESWRGRLRRLALDAGLAALVSAPWLMLNFATTGGWLPGTMGVKHDFFAEGCKPVEWRTGTVVAATTGFLERLGFLAVGFALLALRRPGRLLLLASAVFVTGYWAQFPGALTHFEHRYLHALMPLSVLGLLFAVADPRPMVRRWGILFSALAAATAASFLPSALARYGGHLNADTRSSAMVAQFLANQIPAGAKLLVHDIGYLSTSVSNEIVDLVGLKNPRAAELHRSVTWGTCGDARPLVVHQLALESGARYLVVLDDWESIYRFARSLRKMGWRVDALRPSGVRYQVYQLAPPQNPAQVVLTDDGRFVFGTSR